MDISALTSASALLEDLEGTISSDFGEEDASIEPEEKAKLMEAVKKVMAPLKMSRGVLRRKVTLLLKPLVSPPPESVEPDIVSSLLEEVSLRLEEIRQMDSDIEAKLCQAKLMKYDKSVLNEEIISAANYHLQIQKIVKKVRPLTPIEPRHSSSSNHSNEDALSRAELNQILKAISPKQEIKIPALKCSSFKGEEDRFQFRSFLLSFENTFGCRTDITSAAKLQYLKAHLGGFALRDIEHLSNVDENYSAAIKILKDLYLDKHFIIDSLFHKIDSAPVLNGKNLDDIRAFISEVRAYLHELKEFELDLLEIGTPGNKLVSHLVVDKLPSSFLRELKIDTREEYPSVNILFERYHHVLKTLEKFQKRNVSHSSASASSKSVKDSKPSSSPRTDKKYSSFTAASSKKREHKMSSSKPSTSSEHRPAVARESNPVGDPSSVNCKICDGRHYMSSCTTYVTPSSRRERCVSLGMCGNCSSLKHASGGCPAKRYGLTRPCGLCRSRAHITALCSAEAKARSSNTLQKSTKSKSPSSSENAHLNESSDSTSSQHLCINNGITESNCILPTIAIKVKKGNRVVIARMLLDFGSQRSYFGSKLLRRLGIDFNTLPSFRNTIKTFLGEQERDMRSVDLELLLCGTKFTRVPVFIDPGLDVSFDVKGLKEAMSNILRSRVDIADGFYKDSLGDEVENIDGLLGIDALHHFKHIRVVNCLGGSAFESCRGVIPYGPVKAFLTPSQITSIFEEGSSLPPRQSNHRRNNL